jgi:hypothetical protein
MSSKMKKKLIELFKDETILLFIAITVSVMAKCPGCTVSLQASGLTCSYVQ